MRNCESRFTLQADAFTILIVTDTLSIKNSIYNTLHKDGFGISVVKSILEANEYLTQHAADYMIIDLDIAALDEFNKFIFISKFDSVKKILLNNPNNDLIDEVLYAKGVVDFITKDNAFLHKISQLPQIIEQLEKNKEKSVLLVDEDNARLMQLANAFENRNYTVFSTSCTNEALEFMSVNKIALMIFDMQLSDCNAFEFLEKYRRYILKDLRMSIILTSNSISKQFIRDSLRCGIEDVIRKPYMIEELILKSEISIANDDKENELFCSTQLLEQYKNTVDRSSIVSKTNEKGIITYVNDAFCQISGYTQEELLGHAHSIVRHPDMDALIFKDMWYTIKELKKPWKGKVKNLKKNGQDYWVQTIINPILDSNGDVVEYIGIRTDITDVERTKEYFQKQYNITRGNFKEVMNLSKLYENAIEQSNIILRIDPQHIITYANDMFYKISGYSKEELIGQPYSAIKRHNDMNEEYLKDMWNTIEAGNVWKGQLKNISKSGRPYYTLATVVPIKNSKGEILEYMGIRKDITEVVELHEELEATQREIVYKMGEIGETRSKETGNHVKRVAEYSQLLGQLYGLTSKECEILFTASPMHDIGKVGIPDSILNKPGKLDEKEWKIMKTHSIIGYNILKNSKREVLKAAAIVARDHHEKWDGSGYPKKLKGEDIHIYGRITALADVFDALGSDRCYKKAWSDDKIFKLLEEEKGKHFEPKLVELFMDNLEAFKVIRNKYQDTSE